MNTTKSLLEKFFYHDRLVVLAGIVIVSVIAWFYMAGLHGGVGSHLSMHPMQHWQAGDFISHFVMWTVMMVAMMMPTAGPMILTFATICRGRRQENQPYVDTSIFVFGYLVLSVGFSLLATILQWLLHVHALLNAIGASTSYILSGILLLVTGTYQWSSLKQACLRFCRNPFNFLMGNWQEGRLGALRMGLKHGLLCTGCCWALMALMFVGGVMNLL
jgi:predicted metal-binding membrane protein